MIERHQQEFLLEREQRNDDRAQDDREKRHAGLGRGEELTLQEVDDVRLAPWVGGEEQDRERARDRVGHADAGLDEFASAPLQDREHEDAAQREGGGTDTRHNRIAAATVKVRTHERAVHEQRKRDAGRGQLRKGDAEKDHPSQDEVDAHQRAHEPDEHAGDQRITEDEAGLQHLEHGAHRRALTAPRPSCDARASPRVRLARRGRPGPRPPRSRLRAEREPGA